MTWSDRVDHRASRGPIIQAINDQGIRAFLSLSENPNFDLSGADLGSGAQSTRLSPTHPDLEVISTSTRP